MVLGVTRGSENQPVSNSMHVIVRSEKVWEGPDRILDALEYSDQSGGSWFVLLMPATLKVQDLRTGSSAQLDIATDIFNSRDPWGELVSLPSGEFFFGNGYVTCQAILQAPRLAECQTRRGDIGITDLPSSPGKRMELVLPPDCGSPYRLLATRAGDYTQSDTVQVFHGEPNAPVPVSAELGFPGPILALHSDFGHPRAIVRNLTTGNYEAYRLAILCGE